MTNETSRPRGRPSIPPESRKRNYLSIRLRDDTKLKLEFAAAAHQRSLSEEMESRLDQSFVDAAYPPEIGALAELLARAMFETGDSIAGANRWSGHGSTPWLADSYAFNQALKAAHRILEKAEMEGDSAPHGLFATKAYSRKLARQIGRQIADGIIEVMSGRHKDAGSTAALWTPRVREQLGAIGDRLLRQPADEYFAATTSPAAPTSDAPAPDEA
jgi:hypothetical protein